MASINLPVLTLKMRTRVIAILRRDHTGFDGERANSGDHVAAIRRGIDQALLNPNLGEQVVDIGARNPRWTDDRHLAGERMTAADPVYLQKISGTHCGNQYPVTRFNLRAEDQTQ